MPPHPIVPVYRLTFPYVSVGFPHVIHFYLDTVASADPSGFNFVARTGFANAGVSVAMTAFWNLLKSMFDPATASFGNAHLDHFLNPNWVVTYTEANAVVPTGAGGNSLANIAVYSGYSTNHEKMKVFVEEWLNGGVLRSLNYAGIQAPAQPLARGYFNLGPGAGPNDPYVWARSRDDTFVGAFTSFVMSYSKHWRRKRGLG